MKHDNRKNYSRNKITVIELFLIFQYQAIYSIAYKIGLNKQQFQKIVDEWTNNDGFIIVESKINN